MNDKQRKAREYPGDPVSSGDGPVEHPSPRGLPAIKTPPRDAGIWTKDWRRNLVAVCVGQMVSIAGFTFFMPLLPLYVRTLGAHTISEAVQWAGVMGAGGSLAMALAQPYWGRMSDRWGRKPMVIRSMLGSGATTLLMGLVAAPEQLLALYVVQGVVTGTVASTTALIATSMPRQHLGFGLGMLQVAVFVGSTGGPLTGGLVVDFFGFRASYVAAGALLSVGAGIVAAFVREQFVPSAVTERTRGTWSESRSLMAIAHFPLLIGVIFMIQFANTTVSPVLSVFIAGVAGGENPATSVGMVLGATGAVSAVAAFTLGRMGDRIGHTTILLVCLAGTALAYFPQAYVQQVWQLLLLRMLMGGFVGGLMPSANALVADVVPRQRRGTAFGIAASSSALSHAVGPLFGAGIASFWGLGEVFLATGTLYAATFLWAVLSFHRRGAAGHRKAEAPSRGASPTSLEKASPASGRGADSTCQIK